MKWGFVALAALGRRPGTRPGLVLAAGQEQNTAGLLHGLARAQGGWVTLGVTGALQGLAGEC